MYEKMRSKYIALTIMNKIYLQSQVRLSRPNWRMSSTLYGVIENIGMLGCIRMIFDDILNGFTPLLVNNNRPLRVLLEYW